MCIEQPASNPNMYCKAWLARLETIYTSIPTFATWRIDELAGVFAQYQSVLNQVGTLQTFNKKCDPLVKNLTIIELAIEKARRDRNWIPFNRAALEMGWDIEILRELLVVHA